MLSVIYNMVNSHVGFCAEFMIKIIPLYINIKKDF